MMVAPFDHHDHQHCSAQTLNHALELAAERKLKLTPVRLRTLEILLETHKAMGAYEVLERLSLEGFGGQPPVVYRALEFLVQHGLVHRVARLNAFLACLHPGREHQPIFLICRSCRMVAEAQGGAVLEELSSSAGEIGFTIEAASLEATGLCPACRRSED